MTTSYRRSPSLRTPSLRLDRSPSTHSYRRQSSLRDSSSLRGSFKRSVEMRGNLRA